MLILLAPLAFPCTWYIYDDYGDGSSDGRQSGGTFVSGGWRPDGGTIVYDLPELVSGQITFRLSNVDEAGVSQHDFIELFSGYDGSFSDSRRDNFLQVKFAGDIYDGYDGRVKLQAGPEWYGDVEVGSWTSQYDWDPSQSYDVAVSWGGTTASLAIGGVLSTSIDYSHYGELGFTTLRIPNDGSYTRDGLLDDMVIAGVSLCGDEGVGSEPGDTGGGGSEPVDTGSGGGGGGGGGDGTPTDDGGADTPPADTGTPAVPPTVTRFAVGPDSVVAGETWTADWAVDGDVSALQFCFAAEDSAFDSCSTLQGALGSREFGTTGIQPGTYWAWLDASGPGGTTRSSGVPLTVTAVEDASSAASCASASAPGWVGLCALALLPQRRRSRG